ncbi:MAG: hypothetical protein JWO79_4617 [Actinomycetia bacterium]|jgi:hypothetical protein|nr:hypothetical protein [Actinomycetes bacterium]MDQ1658658.1 hypothetical protein [Cryptosporangiaceae bacterium]
MGLSARTCPDCREDYRDDPATTITGREVCPRCADALLGGSIVGTVAGGSDGGRFGMAAFVANWIRRRP